MPEQTTRSKIPNRPGQVEGKVVVVTGAARGIGRAAAIALAREGAAAVAGIDIAGPVTSTIEVTPATADELAETGRLVEAAGATWLAVKLDQRDSASVTQAARDIARHFGRIDVVFANAGIQMFKALMDMTDADWRDTIEVNLTGSFNVIRAFGPYLIENGSGRIIVTSSTQGQHGTKFGAAYSASKWGIIGLVKAAALELGPHKITVNAVIPGLIDTPLTRHRQRYLQVAGDMHSTTPTAELEAEVEKISKAKTPLGVPWIEPEDIAPVVVFLASDAARMVTGAAYDVTGGDSANNTA